MIEKGKCIFIGLAPVAIEGQSGWCKWPIYTFRHRSSFPVDTGYSVQCPVDWTHGQAQAAVDDEMKKHAGAQHV